MIVHVACDISLHYDDLSRATLHLRPCSTAQDLFSTVGVKVAQLLLNQSDFCEKEHWSNVTLGMTTQGVDVFSIKVDL